MPGTHWTAKDESTLRHHLARLGVAGIAALIDRSPSAVRNKAIAMGMPTTLVQSHKFWTHHELETLKREYSRMPALKLSLQMGRTDQSIIRKANDLGLVSYQNATRLQRGQRSNVRRDLLTHLTY